MLNESFEKIDANVAPKRKLYTGAEIPAVGLGAFGSNRLTSAQIAWRTPKREAPVHYLG